MRWDMRDGLHEGSLSAIIRDGRVSEDVRMGVVAVEGISGVFPRHPNIKTHEMVPDDQIVGWCAACTCGWRGPRWSRVDTSRQAALSKRLAYLPSLGFAVPSVAVEEALRLEWEKHAFPAAAISELSAAVRAAEEAARRLERGVASARKAGVSWAHIGSALGISRQSAHEKWSP